MWRPSSVSLGLLLCTSLKGVGAGDSLLTAWTGSAERVACGATTFRSSGGDRAPTPPLASRVGVLPPPMRSIPTAFTMWTPPSAATRGAAIRSSTSSKSGSTGLCRVASASIPRTARLPARACRRRRQTSPTPLSSTGPEGTEPTGQQSLFIFGVGYVATAIALTYLRKGWAVHGTCTDPRKVKSLGDQGIKVCPEAYLCSEVFRLATA